MNLVIQGGGQRIKVSRRWDDGTEVRVMQGHDPSQGEASGGWKCKDRRNAALPQPGF